MPLINDGASVFHMLVAFLGNKRSLKRGRYLRNKTKITIVRRLIIFLCLVYFGCTLKLWLKLQLSVFWLLS